MQAFLSVCGSHFVKNWELNNNLGIRQKQWPFPRIFQASKKIRTIQGSQTVQKPVVIINFKTRSYIPLGMKNGEKKLKGNSLSLSAKTGWILVIIHAECWWACMSRGKWTPEFISQRTYYRPPLRLLPLILGLPLL